MTENNKTRSKLTLKTINNSSDKNKSSSNSDQITKKDNQQSSLTNKEIQERFKAVAQNQSFNSAEDLQTHQILKKTLQKTNKDQIKSISATDTEQANQIANLQSQEKKQNGDKKDDDRQKNIQQPTEDIKDLFQDSKLQVKQAKIESDDFQIDVFDVRNKIKQSLQISNQQKEEREKLLKQKEELQKKQVSIKTEAIKKKVKKNDNKNDLKEEKKPTTLENTNNKKNKNEKFNHRKLTYFVNSGNEEDEDEDGSFSFRRRKFKAKKSDQSDNNSKEYKKISKEVILPDLIIVSDLAARMSEKTGDVVKKLFSMGMVVTSNQAIDSETAEIIVAEFGHISKRVSDADIESSLHEDQNQYESIARAPVVTIMGHVDHGKTSLLDAVRQTNVVAKEHGGITQHIGASRIKTANGKYITFLDTPGHEAFTEMRSRGANITDIVILVVAADDGVKEQTIEAINHAKAAGVPIIVAVNKIDKPGANPDIVKNELLNYQLVSEELGGDVIFVPVSAKAKTNLDKLEEAILLQAEMLDLKSPNQGKAMGVVLESRVDQNKGVVVTMLVQSGTLDIGDLVVVGNAYGKIRKMSDDAGKVVKIATPSVPVEVLGLDSAPNAGDKFVEVEHEKQARDIILYRQRQEREKKSLKSSAKSISDIFKQSGKDKVKYLNLVVKCDVYGSVEAISNTIIKLNNDEVAIKIIHSATGGITESDVSLASASQAIIVGFNVRANISAKDVANLKGVDIRYYSIIYNLVDDLKMILSGLLNPVKSEDYLGSAEIRQVFKLSTTGKVAGSFVVDGIIKRNAKVRLLRNNIVIYNGTLKTLKRFKDDVKEVKTGFECGIVLDNYDDIKEQDVVECYEINEQSRSL